MEEKILPLDLLIYFGAPKAVAEPGYVTPVIAVTLGQKVRGAVKKKLDYAGGDCKHDEPGQPPEKICHSNDHEVCTSLQPFRDLDDADLLNEEIWTGEAKKIPSYSTNVKRRKYGPERPRKFQVIPQM